MKTITPSNCFLSFFLLLLLSAMNPLRSQPAFQWAVQAGNINSEYGNSTVTDASGNVYVTGTFYGTVDFNPGTSVFNLTSAGSGDIFIMKLSPSGSFVWAVRAGGTLRDDGQRITLDAAGNVLVAGQFISQNADFDPGSGSCLFSSDGWSTDVFILKLSPAGNFIWARQLGSHYSAEVANSIAVDPLGAVYTTGIFVDSSDFDPGVNMFKMGTINATPTTYISKLDASGNFLWAGKLSSDVANSSYSVNFDNTGNAFITGYFQDTVDANPGNGISHLISKGNRDVFLIKLDPACNFLWAKQLGEGGADVGYAVAIDPAENICMTGYFQGNVDFDPGSGVFNLASSGSPLDIFVLKLDKQGNFIWAKRIGGPGTDNAFGIKCNASGSIFISGIFEQTADFDPGSGVYNLISAGTTDIFIAQLNPYGEFVCAGRMGGAFDDNVYGMTLDPSGNIVFTGYFKGTSDFDPSSGGSFNMTSSNGDIFICKWGSCTTTAQHEINRESATRLFPNPAHGRFTVETVGNEENIQANLFDTCGRLVKAITSDQASFEMDVAGLQPGIYFLELSGANRPPSVTKVVLQ